MALDCTRKIVNPVSFCTGWTRNFPGAGRGQRGRAGRADSVEPSHTLVSMDWQLDAAEVRVLGALLEKEIATPEYYPLSLNALVNACNQKSNREPVVSYDEETVEVA